MTAWQIVRDGIWWGTAIDLEEAIEAIHMARRIMPDNHWSVRRMH